MGEPAGVRAAQPPEIIGPWFLWKLLIHGVRRAAAMARRLVRQIAERGGSRARRSC